MNTPQHVKMQVVNNSTTYPEVYISSTTDLEEGIEETKRPNGCCKWCYGGFCFLWETSDLLSNVGVGIAWIGGLHATQPKVQDTCISGTIGSLILFILGIVLLVVWVIGYGLYLCNACFSSKSKQTWNCVSIIKLILQFKILCP